MNMEEVWREKERKEGKTAKTVPARTTGLASCSSLAEGLTGPQYAPLPNRYYGPSFTLPAWFSGQCWSWLCHWHLSTLQLTWPIMHGLLRMPEPDHTL